MEGKLEEGDIFSILFHIYKNSISGLLEIESNQCRKQLVIEDRKIVFALSHRKEDAFGEHLLKKKIIDLDTYTKTSRLMEEKNTRFGRALIELGYFNYDQLWSWILDHLKTIVYSFYETRSGKYRIVPNHERDIENIVLDLDLMEVIVEGVRRFNSRDFLEAKFEIVEHLYVCNPRVLTHMDLKPYEMHVFDLVKRNTSLEDIVKSSELLEIDTLRLLYLFLVVEVISTQQGSTECEPSTLPEEVAGLSTFTSFEEALKHYNLRYELIYKTLSKEIGPIALSILLKAIEDIMENLPTYLQKINLNADGRIDEGTVLKLLWYHDFEKNIGPFLRGLEEILYTEIYAVKRHLGTAYEQQVLKWINGIED